jgi:hypothetical protein
MRRALWMIPLVLPVVAFANPDAPAAKPQINVVTFKVTGMT